MHTAALLEPYRDAPGQRGTALISDNLLDEFDKQLDRDGFDVHMHVMGGRGVRAGLDAIKCTTVYQDPAFKEGGHWLTISRIDV